MGERVPGADRHYLSHLREELREPEGVCESQEAGGVLSVADEPEPRAAREEAEDCRDSPEKQVNGDFKDTTLPKQNGKSSLSSLNTELLTK